MKRNLARIAILLAAALSGGLARADHRVVIVTSASNPLDTISSIDLRKIYMGIPLQDEACHCTGIRNQSDRVLNEIFLQTLVSMSERDYERRLLTLTIQSGRRRPVIMTDRQSIENALREDPSLLTYMWGEEFEETSGLKVIKVLWQRE